ncbi:hypothetical protein QOL99_09005 [Deinococcus sp. MIMF12]|uniref:Uncharacterized protein n=1 Tax=Deinococcus rhizophilus TaxID=3049544 RepID=A0ABT7JGX2_9DEIO|nr:hypothetical protein [Deinococcus rhizophilus]MDL2344290.1 hypothetical protein [Deinococcus rhizophilus]
MADTLLTLLLWLPLALLLGSALLGPRRPWRALAHRGLCCRMAGGDVSGNGGGLWTTGVGTHRRASGRERDQLGQPASAIVADGMVGAALYIPALRQTRQERGRPTAGLRLWPLAFLLLIVLWGAWNLRS